MKRKLFSVITLSILFLFPQDSNAQFNGLLNKVKSSVEKTAKEKGKQSVDNMVRKSNLKNSEKEEFHYGEHSYVLQGNIKVEAYNKHAAGRVTFTHIPSDYDEFEAVYQVLGKTPHGTAAMMPMAIEMYGRNREVGEKCIRLLCYKSNVNTVLSLLIDKFGSQESLSNDDGYHQRYLPAAVLEGATPQNGYNPTEPYTVNMIASVNKHQDMQLYDGRVMYIYIMGKGWDTEQRSIEIVKTSTSELCQIFNCPALLTQCKRIQGTWNGLK
ncbi:MAG: hypothetical protein IJY95_08745 [Bacteroides sp.]|nr:hypothetical protein [Bacteroides sp.]